MRIIRQNTRKITAAAAALVLACALARAGADAAEQTANHKSGAHAKQVSYPAAIRTDRAYNQQILKQVDELVRNEFWSADLAKDVWPKALERERASILASKNLVDLFKSINHTLASLKCSHTEFVTINDETFYFLHDLFGRWKASLKVPMDYVGFVTGPPRCADDQVRYVLDDSPASKAGILVGDRIVSIDGKPYIGVASFFGTSGKTVTVEFERDGKTQKVDLEPRRSDEYTEYVNAIKKSASTLEINHHTVGYVHDWCGGQDAHNALEEVLAGKLWGTEGLILDLRDGYGGNGLEDLDMLYRPPAGYPVFSMKHRDGKTETDHMYYDKPVVALINDGSRSGKELLAFSLKRSGRARLVGLNTAGAVLAGKMSVLDKRCALYLAVQDGTVGGVRLEGVGVAPDIEIPDQCSQSGKNAQLDAAKAELLKLMEKSK